jgi:PAS domain S-box-containing protein
VSAALDFAVQFTGLDRSREHLVRQLDRLAITLASIGDGVLTTDGAGQIELINRAAERLLEISEREAIGKPLTSVVVLDEAAGPPFGERIAAVMETGAAVSISETSLISASGRPRTVDIRAAAIEDGRGVVVVIRDVAERVRLIEERLRASKLESLGILAGGIAHDFNNILQALLGSISLAEFRLAGGRDIGPLLAKARRASLRARDLTKQLLAVSRGGAPVKRPLLVRELLIEAATFAARGTSLRCQFEVTDDLSPVEIDAGQISQVIHNLVINAAQAMPEGGVVTIGAEDWDADVKIWIADRGVGIPHAVMGKIFDPYFTTKETGSGLGLYTAYVIVRRHDGRIVVDSEPGEGTTFTIYLPICESGAQVPEGDAMELSGGRGRVLVMDDEDDVLTITRQMLRHLGYGVDIAREGREATAMFRAAFEEGTGFDMAMLDLTISGGQGGIETIRQLRDVHPGVIAVAMTGYANDDIVTDYRKLGFDAVLVKPFSVVELDRTLRGAQGL